MSPFITQERRGQLKDWPEKDEDFIVLQPGDRCYLFYKEMVERWKAKPRWTTIHEIYKEVRTQVIKFADEDDRIAYELAWQVFFIKYGMPYEDEKERLNGTI